MFKTAADVKLHLSIRGEMEKPHKSFTVVAVSLWSFCEEGTEGLHFPHLFIYRGEKKKRKKEKANQVLYHWKIAQCTGNWEHCDERAKRLKLNQLGGQEFFRTFLKVFQLFWFFLVTYTFPATAWWASGTKGAFVKYSTSLALSSEMQELPATISRDSQEILNKTREKIDLT